MRTRGQRGVGLIDALVALAILGFGLLAITRFQGNLTLQATDSQSRSMANRLADELITTALVDPGNRACYTVPATGSCGNATARANTDAWAARVAASLPGAEPASAVLAGTRLTVTLAWRSKDTGDLRQLIAISDVQ